MNFQVWMTQHGKQLQMIAFFTPLFLLGVLEIYLPKIRDNPQRKHRWLTNFALTMLNIVMLSTLPISAFAVSLFAKQHGWGLLNKVSMPAGIQLLITFVTISLLAYLSHFLSHKVSWLWRFHQIHHLDTHLDISTTVRVHPVEFIQRLMLLTPGIILLGIPWWALITYEVLSAFINVVTHANLGLPSRLERIIRLFFVTPDLHHIHHSSFQPETDSNYGAVFPIWDQIFGTYRPKTVKGIEGLEIGLESPRDRRVQSLFWLLVSPFISKISSEKLGYAAFFSGIFSPREGSR